MLILLSETNVKENWMTRYHISSSRTNRTGNKVFCFYRIWDYTEKYSQFSGGKKRNHYASSIQKFSS